MRAQVLSTSSGRAIGRFDRDAFRVVAADAVAAAAVAHQLVRGERANASRRSRDIPLHGRIKIKTPLVVQNS